MGVHGITFGGAGFVDDALEKAAYGGIRERARIAALGICQDFVLTVGLIQRDVSRLFQFADFEGAMRTFVQELDQLLVDFIDAASPITEVQGATSRRERPWRAASLRDRMSVASAVAARSMATARG